MSPDAPRDSRDSKEALIAAAGEVFAAHGYDGATVKQLAEAAGVNVSLVSYYFNGKEGLYRAVVETFGRGRLDMAERVLKTPETLEEFQLRLKLFLEEFVEQHLSHPCVATILHRDCVGENAVIDDLFKDIFSKLIQTLISFFAAGQKKGFLRKDFDPLLTCGLLFGGIVHMIRMQEKGRKQFGVDIREAKTRETVINNAVRTLTEGVIARGQQP